MGTLEDSDVNDILMAGFREPGMYDHPSLDANKLHVIKDNNTACGRRVYWDDGMRKKAVDVHPVHRCMRNGCKQLWPELYQTEYRVRSTEGEEDV